MFARPCVALGVLVVCLLARPAFASGDPIVVIAFGGAALLHLTVFGYLCWRWQARRTAGVNVVAYVVAVGAVWYWGLNVVAVSDVVFSTVLMGGPPLLALCLELIVKPKKRHVDREFSDRM
jgi:hypothetical protein